MLISFSLSLYSSLSHGEMGRRDLPYIDSVRKIRGVLIDVPGKAPGCGIFCNVLACRIKESTSNKTFILFILCPDLYGKNFFKKDSLYEAYLLPDGNKYKDCIKLNKFQGEKLPIYYVDNIKKLVE